MERKRIRNGSYAGLKSVEVPTVLGARCITPAQAWNEAFIFQGCKERWGREIPQRAEVYRLRVEAEYSAIRILESVKNPWTALAFLQVKWVGSRDAGHGLILELRSGKTKT